ncbi:MAG: alpha/beta hydrolase [Clostridia bacterium]|nr:alpha/beta hydrolase [Clostridia bacterium]
MIYKEIAIEPFAGSPAASEGSFSPSLTLYFPDNSNEVDPLRKRPTVVICPGGGYAFRSRREAEPVALAFIAHDLNAAVLEYSVAPAVFPAALTELARAVAYLRQNSDELHVDADKIAVLGFSAGGHLAANFGTLWDSALVRDITGFTDEHKPNGMILCYPVITSGLRAHRGSIDNLLGDRKDDPELLELVSCEKQVGPGTPPAFIWHTFDDGAVPIQNSLIMTQALADNGINTELHVFPHGPHGLSLANEAVYGCFDGNGRDCQEWIDLAIRWLKNL